MKELKNHYLRGGLFEAFMISDFLKQRYNQALRPNIYFWRDAAGHEVDCIAEQLPQPLAIEIKASKTATPSFFKNLEVWNKKTNSNPQKNVILYTGQEEHHLSSGNVLPWTKAATLLIK